MYGIQETGGLAGLGAGAGLGANSFGGAGIHVVSRAHALPYTGVHFATMVFGAITLVFVGIAFMQLGRRKAYRL